MFDTNLDALDADATLTFAADARSLVDRVETRIIEAAAHYADLNGHLDARFDSGSRLAGMERLVTFDGDGTPEVAEFAPAELGAELQMSQHAAARLIGDALDLRHRLPRLWRRVLAGEVKPWIGRRTAEATRRLPLGAVAVIDAKVSPWAHSLSWGRLEAIVEAACIEADPTGAAELADNASRSQGVWLGQSNDHGIKDIFIRTQAPNAIWFDASIERIAEGLQALGDLSTKDVRRGRAVGVLAQPQRALDLFDRGRRSKPTPRRTTPRRRKPADSTTLTCQRGGAALMTIPDLRQLCTSISVNSPSRATPLEWPGSKESDRSPPTRHAAF